MKYTNIILLAVTLPVFAGDPMVASDPITASDSEKSAKLTVASETEKTDLAMRVTLEQGGKVVTGFTAYTTSFHNDVYCKGVVSSDNLYWRVSLNGNIRELRDISTIEVEVEDLNHLLKKSEGDVVPTIIFNTAQRSKGLGKYILGEIHGMTLKLEISKAEAGAGQPATKPADKPPVKDEPSTPTSKEGPRRQSDKDTFEKGAKLERERTALFRAADSNYLVKLFDAGKTDQLRACLKNRFKHMLGCTFLFGSRRNSAWRVIQVV
jgi:hypothetical protein